MTGYFSAIPREFISCEVLLHDDRRLHEQPGHADDVGAVLLGGLEDRGDRLLDAEVDDRVAVVGQDDVDEVLADVVDVALDGGQDDLALALLALDLLHVRLEVGDGGLHDLGALQHERQLHLAGAEELADDLHPAEQHVVDDRAAASARRPSPRRGRPPGRCFSPSMMRRGRRSLERQRHEQLGAGLPPASRLARPRTGRGRPSAGRSPRGGGRRRGRARPRAARPGSGSSAGSCRRARSRWSARPSGTRAGTPS